MSNVSVVFVKLRKAILGGGCGVKVYVFPFIFLGYGGVRDVEYFFISFFKFLVG